MSITFGIYTDNLPISFEMVLDNQATSRVNQVNYLGIIMDHHSKWDSELEKKTKRLKFTVLVLAKLKKILSPTNSYNIWWQE